MTTPADVHRYANLLHRLGVRRGDAVALMAPNCAELAPSTWDTARRLAGTLDEILVLGPTGAETAGCLSELSMTVRSS